MPVIEPRPEPDHEQDGSLAQQAALKRPLFPAIRWGAVLAGVAVGVSIQLVLALLGIATGLTAIDVTAGDNPGATGSLVWAGISMLIAAFVGGFVAARMSGLKRKGDGVLHGAVSWAVTTLMFATLATSVTGSLLSGIFSNVTPVARNVAVQGGSSAVISMVQRQLGENVDRADLQLLQREIRAGNREAAIRTLTERIGLSPRRAATLADQALIMSGSPDSASPQGRQAAEEAVRYASKAAWGVFLAVALSLGCGIFGGMLGAANARRTNWAAANHVAHA